MKQLKFIFLLILVIGLIIPSVYAIPTPPNFRNSINEEVYKAWGFTDFYPEKTPKIEVNEGVVGEYPLNMDTIGLTFSDERPSIVYGDRHGDIKDDRYRYLGYTKNNGNFTNFLFKDDPGSFACKVVDVNWIPEPWTNKSFQDRFNLIDQNPGPFSSCIPNQSIIDGLRWRYGEKNPNVEDRKNLTDIDKKDWTKYVYVLQPPTRTTWGFGAMGYYGVGGFRYQTLPLAPLPPIYDFTIKEVTAVPDKANSNSEIKLRTRIHAKVDGYSQIKNSIVLRGCVSQAGEYSTIISQSEWTKIGENNFEVIKDITVKTPNITVYGEVSLPAFVEVNPVDSRGEHPLKEPNYNDNSGHTEVTVISELKELRSVLREGYIGWWDTIPVTVQWTEWYWIVDITYCSGDKTHSSHTIDNSRWSAPSVQTNTRYYNGWNEAELDFVPLGYTGIESKQIPQHKGSGKMKILAPWATDSKSRNMYSGYSTIRSGYGFNADILAELNGTYRQTRSIHPDIVKTINLKMNTNCTKTPKVTQMEKISTSEIRHNQTKVDYNGLQADVLGTRWQNSILTPAMEIPKSYKKTADVVISDEIYEYKDTTRQLWKLPINAASKDKTRNADKARKIYIHIDEANGKYQLTGEGLFNNTKGLSTDHRYNRKDVFNLGIFEDMYYDTFPIDKTVEDEEE